METRSIGGVLEGSTFMHDYIPRHCAANGLDPDAFMNPDAEPEPAVCPHCGRPLRYPRMEMPDGSWLWRPIPEPCGNPACIRLEAEDAARRAHNERLAQLPAQLKACGVPAKYMRSTTQNYETPNPMLAAAKDSVLRYIHGLEAERMPAEGLYLTGGVGTGKTHLAAAIARGGLWYGHTVRFVSTLQLAADIKREMNGGDVEGLKLRHQNVGLLILDDIGKEYATDWALSVLMEIIGTRYAERRPTVYTSNYALSGLADALSQHGGRDSAAAIVTRSPVHPCIPPVDAAQSDNRPPPGTHR